MFLTKCVWPRKPVKPNYQTLLSLFRLCRWQNEWFIVKRKHKYTENCMIVGSTFAESLCFLLKFCQHMHTQYSVLSTVIHQSFFAFLLRVKISAHNYLLGEQMNAQHLIGWPFSWKCACFNLNPSSSDLPGIHVFFWTHLTCFHGLRCFIFFLLEEI